MVNGKTRLVGILGWPVEHSISPAIHNAAFRAQNIDYMYLPLPVKPGHLESALNGLKAMNFAGANVTIPHKVEVMAYLDEIDHSASVIGAVNTIVIRNGKSVGFNTDASGFISSLSKKQIAIDGKNAIILGAGGAARAVVCGLLDNKIAHITVVARDAIKALSFAQSFESHNVTGSPWTSAEAACALQESDLVINCTPLGMYPTISEEPVILWENLKKTAVICDLIYNPLRTRFLKHAAELGHQIVGGEGMLIEQASLAYELWTGIKAPLDIMSAAFTEAIGR